MAVHHAAGVRHTIGGSFPGSLGFFRAIEHHENMDCSRAARRINRVRRARP